MEIVFWPFFPVSTGKYLIIMNKFEPGYTIPIDLWHNLQKTLSICNRWPT